MAGTAPARSKHRKPDIEAQESKVWVSDGAGAFILGRIVELSEEGPTIQPFSQPEKLITAGYDSVFPAEEDDKTFSQFLLYFIGFHVTDHHWTHLTY